MTFDPKCYDLARYFLELESERDVCALAQQIQCTIEDWIAYEYGSRHAPPQQPRQSTG
jgi:hypothetical protein